MAAPCALQRAYGLQRDTVMHSSPTFLGLALRLTTGARISVGRRNEPDLALSGVV